MIPPAFRSPAGSSRAAAPQWRKLFPAFALQKARPVYHLFFIKRGEMRGDPRGRVVCIQVARVAASTRRHSDAISSNRDSSPAGDCRGARRAKARIPPHLVFDGLAGLPGPGRNVIHSGASAPRPTPIREFASSVVYSYAHAQRDTRCPHSLSQGTPRALQFYFVLFFRPCLFLCCCFLV